MDEERHSTMRIPNAWRAMAALSDAWEVLEANPDLAGGDIVLALESEAPNVMRLLDALVFTIQAKKDMQDMRVSRTRKIKALIDGDDAAVEKLTDMLSNILIRLNLDRHRAPTGLASLKDYDGAVTVVEADEVPERFKKAVVTTVIDKREIARALKAGEIVPGVVCGNGYRRASIRG